MRVALQVDPVEEAVEASKVDVVSSEEGPEPLEPPVLVVAAPEEAPDSPVLEVATLEAPDALELEAATAEEAAEEPALDVAAPDGTPEAPVLVAATPEEAVEAPALDAKTPELEEATDEEASRLELGTPADVDCLVGTIGVREGTGERMGFEVEATLGSDEGPTVATVEEAREELPEPEGFTDELAWPDSEGEPDGPTDGEEAGTEV